MNERIAAYLAFVFLCGTGLFNIIFVLSNLRKRKVRKLWLWLRMIGGILILVASAAFGYYIIWMKFHS